MCYIQLDEPEKIIEAADALWHFARDHGYSRYTPHEQIDTVADQLYKLERDTEIGVWLERLDEWYEAQESEDQAACEENYRNCQLCVLINMMRYQADDVLARLERDYAKFEKHYTEEPRLANNMAMIYKATKRYDQARWHFEFALKQAIEKGRQTTIDFARAGLASLAEEMAEDAKKNKPWWKVWG